MQQQRRRSRFILGVLFLGLLAGGALTAHPAQAVDAVGPYYALPSWDRSLPAATRFVVLTNWGSHAVLDTETGLVWERSPQAAGDTWNNARVACANKTVDNHKGWRLPSFPELASLVDPSVSPGPTLPAGHPFLTVHSANYWSATTNAVFPTSAWYLDFSLGNVGDVGVKSGIVRAWCVRGGMNADAY